MASILDSHPGFGGMPAERVRELSATSRVRNARSSARFVLTDGSVLSKSEISARFRVPRERVSNILRELRARGVYRPSPADFAASADAS